MCAADDVFDKRFTETKAFDTQKFELSSGWLNFCNRKNISAQLAHAALVSPGKNSSCLGSLLQLFWVYHYSEEMSKAEPEQY